MLPYPWVCHQKNIDLTCNFWHQTFPKWHILNFQSKSAQNKKITPLLLFQLFQFKMSKWSYFLDFWPFSPFFCRFIAMQRKFQISKIQTNFFFFMKKLYYVLLKAQNILIQSNFYEKKSKGIFFNFGISSRLK